MDALQIIRSLGGAAEVARATGVPFSRAFDWGRRQRIPPDYWPALIERATGQKDCPVTIEMLMRHAAPRRPQSKKPEGNV